MLGTRDKNTGNCSGPCNGIVAGLLEPESSAINGNIYCCHECPHAAQVSFVAKCFEPGLVLALGNDDAETVKIRYFVAIAVLSVLGYNLPASVPRWKLLSGKQTWNLKRGPS